MVYINIAIILLLLLLAILSRKNKSKYKDDGCNSVVSMFFGIADYIYHGYFEKFDKSSKHFKVIYTLPAGKEKDIARKYAVKKIIVCLSIILFVNTLSICYLVLRKEADENNNVISRQGYDGNTCFYDLRLEAAGEDEVYKLGVAPIEYTYDEFTEQADMVYTSLCSYILGNNVDEKHVNTDLILPEVYGEGVFDISWSSSNPEIVSIFGRVCNQNLKNEEEVILGLVISYHDFQKQYSIKINVEPITQNTMTKYDVATKEISELERMARTEKEIQLPQEIDGIKISVIKERDNTHIRILLFGLCLCMIYVIIAYSKIKDKSRKTEDELANDYAGFIDSLNLLMESGMTIRGALGYLAVSGELCQKMSTEIKYAINMIDTGYEETYAYALLSERLASKIYLKLFNEIILNVKKGNHDVRLVLNNYAYEAEQICKENIRKKGEHASTKLLVPMFMMLLIVLFILILPAIFNF